MKPIYEISIADQIINFGGRLVSLQITQERERFQGVGSDSVEIVLEDTREPRLAIPPFGDALRVKIGYEGAPLFDKGIFIVDETEVQGPPDHMIIRAQNNPKTPKSDTTSPINTCKSRSWQTPITVGELVAKIAKEHGLTPRVAPVFASIQLPHIDQTDQTDFEIIERYVTRPLDAYATVINGSLIIVPDGTGKSVGGVEIPHVVLWKAKVGEILDPAKTYVSTWRTRFTEFIRYNTALATWHDRDAAKEFTEQAGPGNEPILRLTWPFPTQYWARKAAYGALKRCRRATGEISATFPGAPALIAGGTIQLNGAHPEVETKWYCRRVVHTIGPDGLWTEVQGERITSDYLAEEEMGRPQLASS